MSRVHTWVTRCVSLLKISSESSESSESAARTHDATDTLAQELHRSHDVKSASRKGYPENNRLNKLNKTNHQVVRC